MCRRHGLGLPGWQDDVAAGWWAASCPVQGWSCSGQQIHDNARPQLFLQRKDAGTSGHQKTEVGSESKVGIKLESKSLIPIPRARKQCKHSEGVALASMC